MMSHNQLILFNALRADKMTEILQMMFQMFSIVLLWKIYFF